MVSDDSHPFADEECIAVGLTTTEHTAGIPIDPSDWNTGGTPRKSYVSPWYCVTLKVVDLDRRQGSVNSAFISRVVRELGNYLGLGDREP